jgi:hypothetical protein
VAKDTAQNHPHPFLHHRCVNPMMMMTSSSASSSSSSTAGVAADGVVVAVAAAEADVFSPLFLATAVSSVRVASS